MPDQEDRPLRELTAYELLDMMDAMCPPRSIMLGETLEQAHRYAGRRDLIDELLQVREMERDEDAEDE